MESAGKELRNDTINQPCKPYPGILQAVGLVALWAGVIIVLVLPAALISYSGHYKWIDSPVVGAIATSTAFVIVVPWGFRKTKAPLREIFPFSPIQPALLFGPIHGNLWESSYSILYGLFQGWLFVETRSFGPVSFRPRTNQSPCSRFGGTHHRSRWPLHS